MPKQLCVFLGTVQILDPKSNSSGLRRSPDSEDASSEYILSRLIAGQRGNQHKEEVYCIAAPLDYKTRPLFIKLCQLIIRKKKHKKKGKRKGKQKKEKKKRKEGKREEERARYGQKGAEGNLGQQCSFGLTELIYLYEVHKSETAINLVKM